jgi:hypothetical protein
VGEGTRRRRTRPGLWFSGPVLWPTSFSATCQDSFGYSRRTHPKKTRVTTDPVEEIRGGQGGRGALPGQKRAGLGWIYWDRAGVFVVATRVGEKVPVKSIPCRRLVTLFAAAAPRSTPLTAAGVGAAVPLVVGPVRNQRGKNLFLIPIGLVYKVFFCGWRLWGGGGGGAPTIF